MEINIKEKDNYTVLNIIGRLDTNTAGILENCISNLFEQKKFFFILNLEKLDYISSAGLRVLLGAQKEINKLNGEMIIKNANTDVMEVFSITGFTKILKII